MDVLITIAIAATLLYCAARGLERSDRRHRRQRRRADRRRQRTARQAARREPVDALVIRHLRAR